MSESLVPYFGNPAQCVGHPTPVQTDTQIGVEDASDGANTEVDLDAAYPSDSTQDAFDSDSTQDAFE